ncbi:MAG: undecaprenyl/decaprenyl-phosphate alpha-N-acetylglucosaminyl 1-phosphate transferase [Phycisphaeraceae bacterium]|nr:undecaprenyl/decaprenyl-phosphate alpha-N-acetylglucosaminyl 1-phosphate transferase [Phycisphaeraceae bacterium]
MTSPSFPVQPIMPLRDLDGIAPTTNNIVVGGIELLNTFVPVFLVAFVVSLLLTPIIRRVAVNAEIIDHPDRVRKEHTYPIAYLGGLAVFFGVLAGIAASYTLVRGEAALLRPIPITIVLGMVAITVTGLIDDIWKLDPRLKIAGQLVAAAALAAEDLGMQVARGIFGSFLGEPEHVLVHLTIPMTDAGFDLVSGHFYYWAGVAIIAFLVLGACNSANLIDGLDGLLSGSVAIMAVGFLLISLLMGTVLGVDDPDTTLVAARVALSLALLGAVLGFLPYNFNPAVIFLGDAGSLTLGYLCITIILMFGEQGQASLVMAGLIIFALPVMDTTLAIIRRRLAGVPMSAADANHIHHQLKRSLGSVRKAVLALYAITGFFAIMGVALAAMRLLTGVRVLAIYAITFVFFAFIAAVAIKTARRGAWTLATVREERAAPSATASPEPTGAVEGRAATEPGAAPGPVTSRP